MAPPSSPHHRRARLRLAAALMLAALAALLAGPSHGADGSAELPAEAGTYVLPDARVLQAITLDVDADGRRELLRLTAGEFDGVFLEAWAVTPEGPRRIGQPATVLADQQPGRPDPIRTDAPVRLIAWSDGTRERGLVVSRLRFEERDIGPACCLMLTEPVVEDGVLRLADAGLPSDAVDAVLALDLDGDGGDELLTSRSLPPQGDVSYPLEVRVHWLEDGRFGPPRSWTFPLGSGDAPFHLGDSDGAPGEEAGLLASQGPGGLLRLAWRDDELVQEHSGVAWPLTARAVLAEGRAAVVAAAPRRLSILSWPPGTRADPVASASDLPPVVLGTLPDGDDTVILTTDSDAGFLVPLSTRLVPLLDEPLEPSDTAAQLGGVSVVPYTGPLPLPPDAPPTYAFSGRAVRWDDGSALVRDMASLPNAVPIGPVGHGDVLAVLRADFFLESPAGIRGGPLVPPTTIAGASLSIVPVPELLAAETTGAWRPRAEAVAVEPDGRVLSEPDGFDVTVSGPPGTLIELRGSMDPSGSTELPHGGEARVHIRPDPGPDAASSVAVVARTPAGKGYVVRWPVLVLAGPPDLRVEAVTTPLSPLVEVRGTVAVPADVRVAGHPVTSSANGSFRATVAAPPWPTRIEVTARDPAGNQASTAVVAVGVLDYRGIPWLAVLFVGTLVVAALLFVRVPRAALERHPEQDAQIDELRR